MAVYLGNKLVWGGSGGGIDPNSLPGGKTIIFGDESAGYMGKVTPSEFGTFEDGTEFNGATFCTQLGITRGTAMNSTTDWLKLAHGKEVIYIPQKPIRHSTTWQNIAEADCVFGRKTIKIGDVHYKVTLLQGLAKEMTSYTNIGGSEWDRLVVPLAGEWDTGLTDADLGFENTLNGRLSWCQETTDSKVTVGSQEWAGLRRSLRGGSSVSGADNYYASLVYTNYSGFRPALRVAL